MALDVLTAATRVTLRALLRSAKKFDREAPALKALINRSPEIHPRMTPDMHAVIATFLGSELRTHFVPSPVLPQSVHEAVLTMYRFPPPQCDINTAFSAMRYLDSLLHIGRKHGLGPGSHQPGRSQADGRLVDAGSGGEQPQLLSLPEPGCLLLAHPLLKGGAEPSEHVSSAAFSFARAAVLVCGHTMSLGAYGLCLNKPLPVKAGALALGSPLTRALVGELFSWPQQESESSRELLRRWQAMWAVHRGDPELGFREQIEAADTLDADPYARLRLLLLEKGWFGAAAAAGAAGEEGSSSSDDASTTAVAASASVDSNGAAELDDSQSPTAAAVSHGRNGGSGQSPSGGAASGSGDSRSSGGRKATDEPASYLGGTAAAEPEAADTSAEGAAAHGKVPGPVQPAADVGSGTHMDEDAAPSSSGASSRQEAAQQAAAGQTRSWDGMLLRFAESSLSKGGPLPSLQVLHRHPRLGGQQVLPQTRADGSDALYLGTGSAGLEGEDPALAADIHFFVGDAMWQPGQLEGEISSGAWFAVPPPPALREREGLSRAGSLWDGTLRALGGVFAELARIDKAVVDDLRQIEL